MSRPMKRKRLSDSQQEKSHNKKKRLSKLERLPLEVLETICNKLPLWDRIRMKSLSCSLDSSIHIPSRFLKAPWLFLPPKIPNAPLLSMNLEENILYRTKPHILSSTIPCLIGSSFGSLIFLDIATFTPFLFNPFTNVQTQLPSLKHVFNISQINEISPGKYRILFKHNWGTIKMEDIRKWFVNKAILTADPTNKQENFGVALLCKQGKELVYCINGASKWWIELGNVYKEILCCKGLLYGFYDINSRTCFDSWDLQGCKFNRLPAKKSKSITVPPNTSITFGPGSSTYIVESKGDIVLLYRSTRDQRLFCVYKLDLERKTWTKMDSLGDRSLLIDDNQSSVLISTKDLRTCKRNSIYFTDDCGSRQVVGYKLEDGEESVLSTFGSAKKLMIANQSASWLVPSPEGRCFFF